LLLGATALAVIGYFGLIYGGCALDAHCHLRSCGGRYICGVIHDAHPSPGRWRKAAVLCFAPWNPNFDATIGT